MTISSASSASPAAKTGVGHTTAILAIILVSYFMILLGQAVPPQPEPGTRREPAQMMTSA